jgi:FixJ family two-component response regulator
MPAVLIVNGDGVLREAMAALVRAAGWQAETFADARSFLRHSRRGGPDCAVVDVALPDMNGLELQTLCAGRADMPVIFTGMFPSLRAVVLAMKAGAVDFLTVPLDEDLLLNAVRAALERSRAALVHEEGMRALYRRYETLTLRERQVMARVIAGRMNKLIAEELGISLITVKAHRGKVMRKMRAESLADLVNMAARLDAVMSCSGHVKMARPAWCFA